MKFTHEQLSKLNRAIDDAAYAKGLRYQRHKHGFPCPVREWEDKVWSYILPDCNEMGIDAALKKHMKILNRIIQTAET